VKAETDGEQDVKTIVHDVLGKKAILKPLHLSSKYTVIVTAVYRDGIERKCSGEFFGECGGFIQQLYSVAHSGDNYRSHYGESVSSISMVWRHGKAYICRTF